MVKLIPHISLSLLLAVQPLVSAWDVPLLHHFTSPQQQNALAGSQQQHQEPLQLPDAEEVPKPIPTRVQISTVTQIAYNFPLPVATSLVVIAITPVRANNLAEAILNKLKFLPFMLHERLPTRVDLALHDALGHTKMWKRNQQQQQQAAPQQGQCGSGAVVQAGVSKRQENSGYGNNGNGNSGNQNNGNGNSGNWNTGNGNSGNCNCGNFNSGSNNNGNFQAGNGGNDCACGNVVLQQSQVVIYPNPSTVVYNVPAVISTVTMYNAVVPVTSCITYAQQPQTSVVHYQPVVQPYNQDRQKYPSDCAYWQAQGYECSPGAKNAAVSYLGVGLAAAVGVVLAL